MEYSNNYNGEPYGTAERGVEQAPAWKIRKTKESVQGAFL